MFSSFSGNLSGMTGWIQESSKKAADTLQKSVTDISQGVTEMMAEPATDKKEASDDGVGQQIESKSESEVVQAPAQNKNEVLTQVTAKFSSDVSKVWGTALSFGKNVYEKVGDSEIVKQASEKLIDQAPLVSGIFITYDSEIIYKCSNRINQKRFQQRTRKIHPGKQAWRTYSTAMGGVQR